MEVKKRSKRTTGMLDIFSRSHLRGSKCDVISMILINIPLWCHIFLSIFIVELCDCLNKTWKSFQLNRFNKCLFILYYILIRNVKGVIRRETADDAWSKLQIDAQLLFDLLTYTVELQQYPNTHVQMLLLKAAPARTPAVGLLDLFSLGKWLNVAFQPHFQAALSWLEHSFFFFLNQDLNKCYTLWFPTPGFFSSFASFRWKILPLLFKWTRVAPSAVFAKQLPFSNT